MTNKVKKKTCGPFISYETFILVKWTVLPGTVFSPAALLATQSWHIQHFTGQPMSGLRFSFLQHALASLNLTLPQLFVPDQV